MPKTYSSKQIAIFLSVIVIIFTVASFLRITGYLSLIQANLFRANSIDLPFFREDNIGQFTRGSF